MFSNLKLFLKKHSSFENALLFFCALLPFQFALNPTSGYDLAIIRVIIPVLFCLILFSRKISFRELKNNNIALFLILMMLLALFSLLFSINIFWSLRKLLFLFSIIPLYFIALVLFKRSRFQREAFKTLVVSASILAALSLIQFFSQFIFGIDAVYAFLAKHTAPFFLGKTFSSAVLNYPSWLVSSQNATFMRAVGTFPDPHMLSYFLGMLLPFAIFLGANSRKYSWGFYLCAFLLFTGDIATFTRGGYIALIAGAMIILPLVTKKMRIGILLITMAVFISYFLVPHNPVAGRFISSFDVHEGSNQGRLSNWQQALVIIKDHPLGVGIGMYSLAVDPRADYREPIYAHDLYLDIAAELGIFTAFIFVLIIIYTLRFFWKAAKNDAFYIAAVSSITIFTIHSLVETPLYSVHVLPLFLLLLALSTQAKKYDTLEH